MSPRDPSARGTGKPIRVAVAGCGAVAHTHLQSLRRVRGVEIVAVCDVDEPRAGAVAHEFGVPRTYKDLAELLAHEYPDAVHVLTPPLTHHELTVEALRHGSHVLVEKPMALSRSSADDMIDTARRHSRSLAVCHNFLFEPAFMRVRQLAENGSLGDLLSVDAYWTAWRHGTPDRYANVGWIGQLPGGAVHEIAPHAVYALQALLGPIDLLHATVRSPANLPPPCEEAHLVFGGSFALGWASLSLSTRPQTITVRVHGTEATAAADLISHVAFAHGARLPPRHRRPLGDYPGHDALIARFYESLRAGDPPPVTAEQGRDVVDVLDRLWSTAE